LIAVSTREVPPEIAEYLGVKTSTVYQWTHQRFIPHVKLGRLVRFREQAVMDWVEKRSEAGRIGRMGRLADLKRLTM
jgi:excisionase family DNA binding protein